METPKQGRAQMQGEGFLPQALCPPQAPARCLVAPGAPFKRITPHGAAITTYSAPLPGECGEASLIMG